MHTEETTLTKKDNSIELTYENCKTAFIVETIQTKNIVGKEVNSATGKCRKPRGKKLFNFYVKKGGVVLVSVT